MSEYLPIWIGARALLSEPSRWCRGTIAVNRFGLSTLADAPDAVAWCIGGAMLQAAGDRDRGIEAWRELAAICGIERSGFPASFNDSSSHADILAVLDKGIALGRASRTLPSLLAIPAREMEGVS